jgi:PAS domain S-box-containing protein
MVSRLAMSGKAFHAETTRIHKDGRRIPVSLIAYPVEYASRLVGVVGVYRDISARTDTRRQFEEFLDTVDALALILDTHGRVVYANRSLLDLLGATGSSLLGTDWFDSSLPEDSREGMRHVFESLLSSGTTRHRGVNPIETPAGDRLISWSNTLLRDGYGRATGVASLGIDITEQESGRKVLERRGRILEAVSFASERLLGPGRWEADMAAILEKLGRAADVSRAYFYRVLSHEGGNLIVNYFAEWCASDAAPRMGDPAFERRVLGGRWSSIISSGQAVSGLVRDMPGDEREDLEGWGIRSVHAEPVIYGKRLFGFLGFNDCRTERIWTSEEAVALRAAADILGAAIQRQESESELRSSMAQYAALVDSLSAGVLAESPSRRILYVNRAYCMMFGISSPSDIVGLDGDMAVEAGSTQFVEPSSFKEFTGRCLAEGVPAHSTDLATTRGAVLECDYVPICPEGEAMGHLWLFRDVTEIRASEQNALRAQKLESLGVLAGGIAHDFNNLLTAILGNVSLARMSRDDPDEVGRRLDEAEKASFRARALTQQLLTFSKGGRPVKKLLDVGRLSREVAEFVLAGGKCLCDFRISASLWPAEVDGDQFSQVISNIVLNAQQVMPAGGRITFAASNLDLATDTPPVRAGRYVHFTIADEGPGIPEENLARIFDPYFTTRPDGMGLGLAASYSIVTKHGGYLIAESRQGRGSTFHIYLPSSSRAPAGSAASFTEVDITGCGRILVVDDDEMVLQVAIEMLHALGYRPETARDGGEAESRIRRGIESGRPMAAAILDLTIPGGPGGVDILRRIRQIDPTIPAIVSSGYSNDAVLSNPGEYGFDGMVAKPYRIGDIGAVLRRVLSGSRRKAAGD